LVGAQGAHCLDRPETDPAAAVAGDARRLVERQQPRVLVDDRRIQRIHEAPWRRRLVSGLGETQRRNTHLVPSFQLALGLGAATVHAHLPGTDKLVYQRPRRALEQAEQEVVEPLTGTIIGHPYGTGTGPVATAGRGG